MSSDSEQSLVQKAQQGDRQAFATLYRLWVAKIYAFCQARLAAHQDSEDITEKVFIKALKSIQQFRYNSSFGTWLYAITRNELVDFYRSKRLDPIHLDLDHYPDQGGDREPKEVIDKKRLMVEQLLNQLSGQHRRILELRFLQRLSVLDTASVLGLTEANVKVLTLRALTKARELRYPFTKG